MIVLLDGGYLIEENLKYLIHEMCRLLEKLLNTLNDRAVLKAQKYTDFLEAKFNE